MAKSVGGQYDLPKAKETKSVKGLKMGFWTPSLISVPIQDRIRNDKETSTTQQTRERGLQVIHLSIPEERKGLQSLEHRLPDGQSTATMVF